MGRAATTPLKCQADTSNGATNAQYEIGEARGARLNPPD